VAWTGQAGEGVDPAEGNVGWDAVTAQEVRDGVAGHCVDAAVLGRHAPAGRCRLEVGDVPQLGLLTPAPLLGLGSSAGRRLGVCNRSTQRFVSRRFASSPNGSVARTCAPTWHFANPNLQCAGAAVELGVVGGAALPLLAGPVAS
jgi:hypothetical protein